MNAPIDGFAAAQRLFERRIPDSRDSEAEARYIETAKKYALEDLVRVAQTNDKDAYRVAENIPGCINEEQVLKLYRAVLRADKDAVFDLMSAAVNGALDYEAQRDAEKQLEEAVDNGWI